METITKNSNPFYYYFKEKIFLQQVRDKIFLKFTPETNKEQFIAIMYSDAPKIICKKFWKTQKNIYICDVRLA